MGRETTPATLWRCPACGFKSRDVAEVRAHVHQPPSYFFGPHVPYAPPTLTHGGMTLDDLAEESCR